MHKRQGKHGKNQITGKENKKRHAKHKGIKACVAVGIKLQNLNINRVIEQGKIQGDKGV